MGKRILVIDDDDDVRTLSDMSLSLVGGHEVRSAASAEEGLAMISEWTPDLVLLDVRLPGMDGPATLAAIRSNPMALAIPVVFITASVSPAELARLGTLDVLGVLPKPFDPMQLPAEIARLTGW